jgi:alpha-tubulin suppressor-like RCC1 family protein
LENPPTGLAAISVGGAHSLGLKGDGTLVAWGANKKGQCMVPTRLANSVAIAAGEAHNAVLKSDGTALAWGSDTYGESRSRGALITLGRPMCRAT